MIYLFAGDDTKKKHESYGIFLKALPKGTETFLISRNDFNRMQIESLYSGSGLFFNKCAVILSGIMEREESRDFILDKLSLMEGSGNDFVFLEGKLNKLVLDEFKKVQKDKTKLNIFELPKADMERFNTFLLANALGEKNRLNLWINFRLALSKGVALEEMIGVFFWKAKDMILKKNFGKFSESELKNFASKISYLLPEARRKGRDDEYAFEQFLLEAF